MTKITVQMYKLTVPPMGAPRITVDIPERACIFVGVQVKLDELFVVVEGDADARVVSEEFEIYRTGDALTQLHNQVRDYIGSGVLHGADVLHIYHIRPY